MAHRGSTCPRDQGRAATWRLMIPQSSWHPGSKPHRRPIDLGTKFLKGSSIHRVPALLAYRVPGNPARRGIIDTQGPSSLGCLRHLGIESLNGSSIPRVQVSSVPRSPWCQADRGIANTGVPSFVGPSPTLGSSRSRDQGIKRIEPPCDSTRHQQLGFKDPWSSR